jgi:hypothetical protein
MTRYSRFPRLGNVNSSKSFRQDVSLAGRFCSGLSELKIALLGGRWGTGFWFVLRLVQAGNPAELCLGLKFVTVLRQRLDRR